MIGDFVLKNRLKMKKYSLLLVLLISITAFTFAQSKVVNQYSVCWDSPSENAAGSMPLGNGKMGMNAWVEKNGDLMLMLSHTDAYSELNRLLKLGRIRLSLSPNPFTEGEFFSQVLNLQEGVIEIKAGKEKEQIALKLYFDPQEPLAYMTFESEKKYNLEVVAESWRRIPHVIESESELFSSWQMLHSPDSILKRESADHFFSDVPGLAWCHYNNNSQYAVTMHLQSLEDVSSNFPDPIIHRRFGAYVSSKEMYRLNDSTLTTKNPVKRAIISMASLADQNSKSNKDWLQKVCKISRKSSASKALDNSQKWWKEYWNRSYIFVETPAEPDFGFRLTQAYILQRYLSACGGRGEFPISFNGSIFTTEPSLVESEKKFNPDYRNWGGAYWFQNTRLFYYPMLISGDWDLMQPLFRFYFDRIPAFQQIAKNCWNAEGIVIPETVTAYGTYANSDFGWNRESLKPHEVESKYIRYYWNQGLELSKMMLDYFIFSNDSAFLKQKALPFAKETIRFFSSKFTQKDGRMVISPTQVLETYWYNVVNDMPNVAGLHCVINILLSLPENCISSQERLYYEQVKKSLPALPLKSTVNGTQLYPASSYLETGVTTNRENGELYAVFPFGLINFSNEQKEAGIYSFNHRTFYNNKCWGYDGPTAGILGLTNDCVKILKEKIEIGNDRNHRFPIMWGNADWVPDQCYGGNLLMTLQNMVIQSYGETVYVLPAFPKDWNVSFKLYTPYSNCIEGNYKLGKWVKSPVLKNEAIQKISIVN